MFTWIFSTILKYNLQIILAIQFQSFWVDQHLSGYPKGHFYGASGSGFTGKWIGQKSSFLEGGIRVPAIISFPKRIPKGLVRHQIITAMDWFPTILDLCGFARESGDPKVDGHSLLPLIENENAKSNYDGVLNFAWGNRWAVRVGEWKLLGSTVNDNVSLRRLTDEQPEQKDYAATQPEIVSQLRQRYRSWVEEVTPGS